jgi:hypothetical protein
MDDVARAARVSKQTVSAVINNKSGIAEKTRAHRFCIIEFATSFATLSPPINGLLSWEAQGVSKTDVCVEVHSPSNSLNEMDEKKSCLTRLSLQR